MKAQDEPTIKSEVDQKKVVVNSKNDTKTSENYTENQPCKIKQKIEPTESNELKIEAKIEPKNQTKKEEVVDKPKATDIQSSKANLDEPRIASKNDTKPSQDDLINTQNKAMNMENKLQYLQKEPT
eukprot:12309441-Ditylum_brightwellii.AAC.1